MKTPEELNALQHEVETLNKKLAELTAEELAQVSGGAWNPFADVPAGRGNVSEGSELIPEKATRG